MNHDEAVALIREGIPGHSRIWADLGAGGGTFTFALEDLLGFGGVIFPVDKNLEILRSKLKSSYVRSSIHLYERDFTMSLDMLPPLDGILLANSLHYVRDQESFLRRLATEHLKPEGNILFVEYDREHSNPWIPYPVSFVSLQRLCLKCSLSLPEEIGRMPSIYGNQDIYAAVAKVLDDDD